MDTKTFLERVHASSDEVVIFTVRDGVPWNRGSFSNLDEAATKIQSWDNEEKTTVYYSVGSFKGHQYQENGRDKWYRKAEYVTYFKSLACDIDVGAHKGSPYNTQEDAIKALVTCVKAIGLPTPMVVSSGHGVHVYWPLTEEITKRQWVVLSDALGKAFTEHGFVFDASKIKEPAMVLRPVGAHHKGGSEWKQVSVLVNGGQYDKFVIAGVLQKWITNEPAQPVTPKRKSSVADAVLSSNDVVLDRLVENCGQIRALVESGGFFDAAGDEVVEPMWRASLGIAKFCTDPEEAIILMAGQHPDFDLQANKQKLEGWNGSGPTTCATFQQNCTSGCDGCPYKGEIKSPAQLSSKTTQKVEIEAGEEEEIELPDGYVIRDNKIYKEVKVKTEVLDANGDTQVIDQMEWELVSHYQMHVTGIYKNYDTGATTFRLAVKFPMIGWAEEDHEVDTLTSSQNVAKFLHNRQIFDAKTPSQYERIRVFIVDYLAKVQSMSPSGVDFNHFGWQKDGSFLCGDEIIGGENVPSKRRLKGAATRFDGDVGKSGTLEGWIEAMTILERDEAKMMRMMMFLAVGSALSGAVGNCTGVISIYSPKTTTGKTLALHAINSLFGHPKKLLLTKRDTTNALYKIRGVLNQLPCTVDELSTADATEAINYTYDLSSGVEKNSMDQKRDLRDPARWTGPTFISTNVGFHQLFDMAQTNDSALRARCIEVIHNDRRLVDKAGKPYSDSDLFFDKIAENHGWAYPELIKYVVAAGGDRELYKKGKEAFINKFGAPFEAVDKFAEPMIVCGWIMSLAARKLGLFNFDVHQTAQDWINHVKDTHVYEKANAVDAIDIVNEFLREYNDEIVNTSMLDTDAKESIKFPVPTKAIARTKVIVDSTGKIKQGSYIAVNIASFKKWLSKHKDGVDRVAQELAEMGALISNRERITLFKGCPNANPGQAYCLMINLAHQRYTDTIQGDEAVKHSKVISAILGGANATQLP